MTDEELAEALGAIRLEELSAPMRLVVEGLRRVIARQEKEIEELRGQVEGLSWRVEEAERGLVDLRLQGGAR